MKILNIEQFNEKLNIQPVTKDKLNDTTKSIHSYSKQSKDYVFEFKTGDTVTVGENHMPYCGTYLSYYDIMRHTYDHILGHVSSMFSGGYGNCKDGVFVHYENDKSKYSFAALALFDENLVFGKLCVWEIYRDKNIKLPLDEEYFKNPITYMTKDNLVWSRM